jgi:cytoskeletal protein CcmA (bactofilin family)
MTSSLASTVTAAHLDDSNSVLPEKTPLFVGLGIVIEGVIRYDGADKSQRLVILGEVNGDIITTGILQIAKGATVRAASKIECAEIIVAGNLIGEGVSVRAGLIVLQPTSVVKVDTLCLPPGGLEQSRGSMLNAKLDMSEEYASLAKTETNVGATEAGKTLTQIETAPAAKVALVPVSSIAPVVAMPGDDAIDLDASSAVASSSHSSGHFPQTSHFRSNRD